MQIRRDGGQGPPLVYVPGIDGTGDLLLDTEAELHRSFRVLALRYVGGQVGARAGYPDLARAVLDRMDEGGVEKTLLLGESFGVALCLHVALQAPSRVRGMALVNGFAYCRRRIGLRVAIALSRFLPPGLFRIGRKVFIPTMLIGRGDRALARRVAALEGGRLDAAYRQRLRCIAGLDLRGSLGGIRVPVAIFASTKDRIVDSVDAGREMAEALPDATLELLDGRGHVVLPIGSDRWRERLLALDARARRSQASAD